VITLRSEKAPGSYELALSDFPASVGRAPNSVVLIEDKGVWENHCTLRLSEGFVELAPEPKANTYRNRELVSQPTRLRSGDLLTFGSTSFIIETSSPIRKSLRPRETLLWTILAITTFLEIALLWRFY
jgi:pSer/pThr/pTyr-binding forkhead associated (FHA) protein